MSGQGVQDHPPVADMEQRAVSGIAEQVQELRRLAQAEAQGRAEIERYVLASRERERRILKAVQALEGIAPKPKPAAKRAALGVSRERADQIFEAVREAGEPVNTARIIEATGFPQTRVSAGLRMLREEGRIRLAGIDETSTAPRKPNLYTVMPDAA